jgi:uncharacterized protein (DUF2147 family)
MCSGSEKLANIRQNEGRCLPSDTFVSEIAQHSAVGETACHPDSLHHEPWRSISANSAAVAVCRRVELHYPCMEATRTPSARGSEKFRRLALPIVVVLAAAGAADPAILGHWLTESGHGVIEIVRCENAVCGRIVGIDRTPSEPMPTDVTGQSQCGLTIISGATQAEDNAWYGKIVDPRDGATYHAKLWVDSDGRLHLRGYIGIPLLGSTQVWSRFTGRLAENCRFG